MNKTTNILLAVIAGALIWPQAYPAIRSAINTAIWDRNAYQVRVKRYQKAVAHQTDLYRKHCDDVLLDYPDVAPPGLFLHNDEEVLEECVENLGTLEQWLESRIGHLKP